MIQRVEFTSDNYERQSGMSITQDGVIAVRRSIDSLVVINRRARARLSGRVDPSGGRAAYLPTLNIEPQHLLVGISKDPSVSPFLEELGLDTIQITDFLADYAAPPGERTRERQSALKYLPSALPNIPHSMTNDDFERVGRRAKDTLLRAAEEARQLKMSQVDTGHLLLALCFDPGSELEEVTAGLGVGTEKIREHVFARITGEPSPYADHEEYVAKHKGRQVPLSIHYISAYLSDEKADPKLRAELVKGMDDIARRIDEVDPRS